MKNFEEGKVGATYSNGKPLTVDLSNEESDEDEEQRQDQTGSKRRRVEQDGSHKVEVDRIGDGETGAQSADSYEEEVNLH